MKLWAIPHDGDPTVKFNVLDLRRLGTHLKLLRLCLERRAKIRFRLELRRKREIREDEF